MNSQTDAELTQENILGSLRLMQRKRHIKIELCVGLQQ